MFDGLDDAIIGVGQQHGSPTLIIYDRDKCIDILADKFLNERDTLMPDGDPDAAYLEAVEWFEHNVECLYAGEHTPIIMQSIDEI